MFRVPIDYILLPGLKGVVVWTCLLLEDMVWHEQMVIERPRHLHIMQKEMVQNSDVVHFVLRGLMNLELILLNYGLVVDARSDRFSQFIFAKNLKSLVTFRRDRRQEILVVLCEARYVHVWTQFLHHARSEARFIHLVVRSFEVLIVTQVQREVFEVSLFRP